MAYTDVITLEQAKTYLGWDDTSRDAEITIMIEAALQLVESETNHLVVQQPTKSYLLYEGCKRVYDYPINTLDADLPSSVTRTQKEGYSIYEDIDNETLTLDVGYVDPSTVPAGLKQMGLIKIRQMFEENPEYKKELYDRLRDRFKRFIV